MIFGLEEKPEETSSSICDCIKNSIKLDIQIKSMTRIGKPENNPRPLQLKLESNSIRNQILSKAKELRKLEGAKVFINPDYTKREREEQRKLRVY